MFPHTKPPAGTQINPLHPLSNGLVGCWLFNEGSGSLANDLSGNKNHGRLTNMDQNVQGSGWGSDGVDYDGVDDYVSVGDVDVTDDLTVEFMVKLDTVAPIIQYPIGLSSNTQGIFAAYTDDKWGIYTGSALFGSSVQIDTWYHMVVTKVETTYTLYLDGKYDNSGTRADVNISNLNFGIRQPGNIGPFNGTMNFVRIYNQTKSPEEVAWLYKEPYAMFEPAFNPALLYSAAPPIGAIMNQFQQASIGADLYNGVFA